MSKTAMQQLIDILRDENHLYNPRNNQDDNDTYMYCIDEAKLLLEKEKEQIIDAFNEGIDEMAFATSGINYYNQTYNN